MSEEVAAISFPLEKLSAMFSAMSSNKLVKVATPATTVAVTVPRSGPRATGKRNGHHRGVIIRFDVAVLILFIDHGLRSANARPGRCWVVDGSISTFNWVAGAGLTVRKWLISVAGK